MIVEPLIIIVVVVSFIGSLRFGRRTVLRGMVAMAMTLLLVFIMMMTTTTTTTTTSTRFSSCSSSSSSSTTAMIDVVATVAAVVPRRNGKTRGTVVRPCVCASTTTMTTTTWLLHYLQRGTNISTLPSSCPSTTTTRRRRIQPQQRLQSTICTIPADTSLLLLQKQQKQPYQSNLMFQPMPQSRWQSGTKPMAFSSSLSSSLLFLFIHNKAQQRTYPYYENIAQPLYLRNNQQQQQQRQPQYWRTDKDWQRRQQRRRWPCCYRRHPSRHVVSFHQSLCLLFPLATTSSLFQRGGGNGQEQEEEEETKGRQQQQMSTEQWRHCSHWNNSHDNSLVVDNNDLQDNHPNNNNNNHNNKTNVVLSTTTTEGWKDERQGNLCTTVSTHTIDNNNITSLTNSPLLLLLSSSVNETENCCDGDDDDGGDCSHRSSSSSSRVRAAIAMTLSLAYFTVMGAKCALPSVLPLLVDTGSRSDSGGGGSTRGLIFTIHQDPTTSMQQMLTYSTLAIAFGKLLLGPIIDRNGGSTSLKVLLSLLMILFGSLSINSSYTTFAFVYIMIDFFFSACWPAAIHTIHEFFPSNEWGKLIGQLAMGARAGNAISFWLFAQILHFFQQTQTKQQQGLFLSSSWWNYLQHQPWRPVFALSGLIQLIPLSLLFLWCRPKYRYIDDIMTRPPLAPETLTTTTSTTTLGTTAIMEDATMGFTNNEGVNARMETPPEHEQLQQQQQSNTTTNNANHNENHVVTGEQQQKQVSESSSASTTTTTTGSVAAVAMSLSSFSQTWKIVIQEMQRLEFWFHWINRSVLMVYASILLFVPTILCQLYQTSSSFGSHVGSIYALGCLLAMLLGSQRYSTLATTTRTPTTRTPTSFTNETTMTTEIVTRAATTTANVSSSSSSLSVSSSLSLLFPSSREEEINQNSLRRRRHVLALVVMLGCATFASAIQWAHVTPQVSFTLSPIGAAMSFFVWGAAMAIPFYSTLFVCLFYCWLLLQVVVVVVVLVVVNCVVFGLGPPVPAHLYVFSICLFFLLVGLPNKQTGTHSKQPKRRRMCTVFFCFSFFVFD